MRLLLSQLLGGSWMRLAVGLLLARLPQASLLLLGVEGEISCAPRRWKICIKTLTA